MPNYRTSTAYQHVATADGARYILPRRQLGPGRWLGLLPILFGCFFSGFALFWMWGASGAMWNNQGRFQWIGLTFMLFGLPFVLVGFMPIGMGLTVIAGRGEVIVRNGKLIAREKIGPFFWSRKRQVDGIERFELVRDYQSKNNTAQKMNLGKFSAFRAVGSDIKPMIVAWGYERDMLEELANHLAQRCQARGPTKLFNESTDEIAVVDAPEEDDITDTETPTDGRLPDPPAKTKILLDVHDAGVTLTIPPAGLRSKGAMGMLTFSLIWCGFMAVFTTLMVFAEDGTKNLWVAIPFIGLFWAIGIGMFLGALNSAKQQAIIDVVGFPPNAVLLITRQGLFATKQQEIPLEQIEAIRMDNSGMEVNDVPVKNLQVHRKQGKKIGLLSGRDEDELKWVAAVLRYALDVPAEA